MPNPINPIDESKLFSYSGMHQGIVLAHQVIANPKASISEDTVCISEEARKSAKRHKEEAEPPKVEEVKVEKQKSEEIKQEPKEEKSGTQMKSDSSLKEVIVAGKKEKKVK